MNNKVVVQPLTYSPHGAAVRIGISVRAVYTQIALGEIRSFKLGKRRLITDAELTRFVSQKMQEAA